MKAANGLNTLTVSGEKLPRRPLMRFQMNRGTVIFFGGGGSGAGRGELQVRGIGSHRLVHKEVAEAQSNCKKSYFW